MEVINQEKRKHHRTANILTSEKNENKGRTSSSKGKGLLEGSTMQKKTKATNPLVRVGC